MYHPWQMLDLSSLSDINSIKKTYQIDINTQKTTSAPNFLTVVGIADHTKPSFFAGLCYRKVLDKLIAECLKSGGNLMEVSLILPSPIMLTPGGWTAPAAGADRRPSGCTPAVAMKMVAMGWVNP
jgi:hypothetical protein